MLGGNVFAPEENGELPLKLCHAADGLGRVTKRIAVQVGPPRQEDGETNQNSQRSPARFRATRRRAEEVETPFGYSLPAEAIRRP